MKGRVLFWSTEPVAPLSELPAPASVQRSRVRSLAFSPQGQLAIATDWTGKVERWQGTSFVDSLQAYTGQVTAVAYTQRGLLLTGGGDVGPDADQPDAPLGDQAAPLVVSVKLWDGHHLVMALPAPPGLVRALAVSDGDRWLAAGVGDSVTVWRLPQGDRVAQFSGVGEVTALAFRHQGLWAIGSKGAVLATSDAFIPGTVNGRLRGSAAAGMSPSILAAGDYDAVQIYRMPDLQPLEKVAGRAYAVAAMGGGLWIVTADQLLLVDDAGALIGQHSLRSP